jgi:hypothetical protein
MADNPLTAVLARRDLSPRACAFLADLAGQAMRRPLSPRQVAAAARIASAPPAPDFAAVNAAATARAEDVCRRLLPCGVRHGAVWACGDLTGAAGQSLRVCLAGERAGRWVDFATGERGGDFISLAAAVARLPQAAAARGLARMLGVAEGRTDGR